MKLVLLPDGAPGEDLGIAHMLKHWCNPREMWEDIAEGVEAEHLPRAVIEGLPPAPEGPAWARADEPHPELAAHWSRLVVPYRHGYGRRVQQLAEALTDPGQAGWTRDVRPGVWGCHAGEGVVLLVKGSRLYTAFRPADFKLLDYDCPPRDARNVKHRRAMAELAARKKLARMRRR